MTSQNPFGRKVGLLGTAAALSAALAIPAAVGAQDENAMVRVLHGAGDAPAVDIYANGGLIGEGLAYTEITDYLSVPADTYQIQVVPAGATLEEGPVVIDAALTFEPGTMTTVAATGSLAAGIMPQVLADDPMPSAENAQVRVVHYSFDAPAVDIAPDGDAAIIEGLEYPANTEYLDLKGLYCRPLENRFPDTFHARLDRTQGKEFSRTLRPHTQNQTERHNCRNYRGLDFHLERITSIRSNVSSNVEYTNWLKTQSRNTTKGVSADFHSA